MLKRTADRWSAGCGSEYGVAQSAVHLLRCPLALVEDEKGRNHRGGVAGPGMVPGGGEVRTALDSLFVCNIKGMVGQGPAQWMGTLLVGVVSRHSLDRLHTSNDSPPKKIQAAGRLT